MSGQVSIEVKRGYGDPRAWEFLDLGVSTGALGLWKSSKLSLLKDEAFLQPKC